MQLSRDKVVQETIARLECVKTTQMELGSLFTFVSNDLLYVSIRNH